MQGSIMDVIQPFDRDALRHKFQAAKPFPFVSIENFLDPAFARDIADAYPKFEDAQEQGRTFNAVNEKKKVQITDARSFPAPVAQLNTALASPAFLSNLSHITGIPHLLADEFLEGGGMHVTGPGGRLDVHIDFNYMERRKLYRRVNLLVYLNPVWDEKWGGDIQLWDEDVKHCRQSFAPVMNRCVIFETSEISFHGVVPVSASAPVPRISFATYYYTRERPANWVGGVHSTVFKARPEERVRGFVLMPAEAIQQRISLGVHHLKRGIKRLVNADRP
jgi:hypothetical protein